MADQIFSTVQIEVNRWRYLPVSCTVPATGAGLAGVVTADVTVSYIKYGQLAFTAYVPDAHTTTLAVDAALGATTIQLTDSSNFPPENGRIYISAAEYADYSYNNVSTGQLVLTTGLAGAHLAAVTVRRIDWIEPVGTMAGNYLLSFPPSILDTVDLFTYQITPTAPPQFDPFQNTIDIVDVGATGTLATPSLATCKLYGFLLDVAGNAIQNSVVSARLLGTPALTGSSAVSDSIVSAKTDTSGYFELVVAQGMTVDVIIPDAGYRRTIVVPSTTLAKLFEIA